MRSIFFLLLVGSVQAAPLPLRYTEGEASLTFIRAGDTYANALVIVDDQKKNYVLLLEMPDAKVLYINGFQATDKQLEALQARCYQLKESTGYLPCRVWSRNGHVHRIEMVSKE